ncbi:hypothetical protein B5P23_15490 [Clavibacter michiganensis subsp. michiganensis]|nr:hypothetical protein B5P23_15490 [Clavibacter michiganensis subsp. michiganensis]
MSPRKPSVPADPPSRARSRLPGPRGGHELRGRHRGDPQARGLALGRSSGSWYVSRSRDRLPNPWKIQRIVAALGAAGFAVDAEVSTDIRPVARSRPRRSSGRPTASTRWTRRPSGRRSRRSRPAERAAAALRRLREGGEPIKVGQHAAGRHRNAIDKAHAALGRSVEAGRDAERARGRADAARITPMRATPPSPSPSPSPTASRGSAPRSASSNAGSPRTSRTPSAATAPPRPRSRRAAPRASPRTSRRSPTKSPTGRACALGRSPPARGRVRRTNVQKGEHVKIRGAWRRVVCVNLKTVSLETGYTWTDTTPYAEIQELLRPA